MVELAMAPRARPTAWVVESRVVVALPSSMASSMVEGERDKGVIGSRVMRGRSTSRRALLEAAARLEWGSEWL